MNLDEKIDSPIYSFPDQFQLETIEVVLKQRAGEKNLFSGSDIFYQFTAGISAPVNCVVFPAAPCLKF